MASVITVYNGFRKRLGKKELDLSADTLKVVLLSSSYTPSQTHELLADLSGQLANGNGYTTGGAQLTNVAWTPSGNTYILTADDTVFTASGSGISARYAVVYDDTSTGDVLIAYVLLDDTPANVAATAGNTLTLDWASAGIITLG